MIVLLAMTVLWAVLCARVIVGASKDYRDDLAAMAACAERAQHHDIDPYLDSTGQAWADHLARIRSGP